jgi:hypothetical protein
MKLNTQVFQPKPLTLFADNLPGENLATTCFTIFPKHPTSRFILNGQHFPGAVKPLNSNAGKKAKQAFPSSMRQCVSCGRVDGCTTGPGF